MKADLFKNSIFSSKIGKKLSIKAAAATTKVPTAATTKITAKIMTATELNSTLTAASRLQKQLLQQQKHL